MRRSFLPGVLICLGFALLCDDVRAQKPEQAQDQESQSTLSALDELRARIDVLESRPGMFLGTAPKFEQGPIVNTHNMNDRQGPAPRVGNLAVDPEMRGFFPVFGSSMLLKLNAKPRVDAFFDNDNAGNDDRFVPAQFPLPGDSGYGGGGQFNMTTNATQLSFEARDPDNPSGFRFYYQNDFYGAANENMRYRLQHAYGQSHNVVAGFTFGVFEDPDIWPDTVDYEGPNSLIFARRPVLHYKARFGEEVTGTFGVEQPDIYLDGTAAPDTTLNTRVPDAGFNVRWERRGSGHAQASTIFRSIGAQGPGIEKQEVFGWGANLSAGLQVTESSDFGMLLVGGEGVGGLGNDTSFLNSDAAIDASGNLVALPYYSVLFSFRHRWSELWRSTATYGFVSLDSVDGQSADAYESSHYASVNLIRAFAKQKQATAGVELLYGDKSVRDDDTTDVFRLQFGLTYWLF